MVAHLTRQLDLFQEPFLKWIEADFDGTQRQRRLRLSIGRCYSKPGGVIRFKVGLLPVALEDGGDLLPQELVGGRAWCRHLYSIGWA